MHEGAVTSNIAGHNLTFVLAVAFLWNSQLYDAKKPKRVEHMPHSFLLSIENKDYYTLVVLKILFAITASTLFFAQIKCEMVGIVIEIL
jgi:hypothetical protein